MFVKTHRGFYVLDEDDEKRIQMVLDKMGLEPAKEKDCVLVYPEEDE